jgi:hypothetical protein
VARKLITVRVWQVALTGSRRVMSGRAFRAHIRSNVVGYVALFFALSLSTAWALERNSVRSKHIVNSQVKSPDVRNFNLNDEDVGQSRRVNFNVLIGNVNPNQCDQHQITGLNARLDHVLLTPDSNTAEDDLVYSVLHSSQTGGGSTEGFVMIAVCNPTEVAIDDGETSFNLLVFDAQ